MIKDGFRVRQITTTTGTGELTLTNIAGFVDFITAFGTAGDTFFYSLQDANGTAWECGMGSLSAGKLQRTTVLSSSNDNAAIVLTSGNHYVSNTPVNGYATGAMDFQGLPLKKPQLQAYNETVGTPAIASGVLTLDLSTANVFNVAHNANITTLTITDAPATDISKSFTLNLTQDATGGRTITLPASIKNPGGVAPTLTVTASKRNKLVLDTTDGGTTWDLAFIGKDYA